MSSPFNSFLQVAMQQALGQMGLSGDDAVALIDAIASKQVVLGYLRERTTADSRYTCLVRGTDGNWLHFILQQGNDGRLSLVQEVSHV